MQTHRLQRRLVPKFSVHDTHPLRVSPPLLERHLDATSAYNQPQHLDAQRRGDLLVGGHLDSSHCCVAIDAQQRFGTSALRRRDDDEIVDVQQQNRAVLFDGDASGVQHRRNDARENARSGAQSKRHDCPNPDSAVATELSRPEERQEPLLMAHDSCVIEAALDVRATDPHAADADARCCRHPLDGLYQRVACDCVRAQPLDLFRARQLLRRVKDEAQLPCATLGKQRRSCAEKRMIAS